MYLSQGGMLKIFLIISNKNILPRCVRNVVAALLCGKQHDHDHNMMPSRHSVMRIALDGTGAESEVNGVWGELS